MDNPTAQDPAPEAIQDLQEREAAAQDSAQGLPTLPVPAFLRALTRRAQASLLDQAGLEARAELCPRVPCAKEKNDSRRVLP